MKLYSGPLSLFTAKVRIALAEKALAYERIEVGWSLKQRYLPHHPDVVALNPKGQVPVLVDGDLVVYDSTLILEYLEERHPEPALYPRELAQRARCRQLEAAADEILFPLLWDLIEGAFYPGGEGGRAEAARPRLAEHYDGLEKELTGREYLCDAYGVADIASFVFVSTAATLGAAPAAERHPQLLAWLARTLARPPVRAELEAMQAHLASARARS